MEHREDIFNSALNELRNGKTVDEVVSKLPDRAELAPLLHTVEIFSRIPVKEVPEPVMRRKFILTPAKTWVWTNWVHMVRFSAVSTAAVLLVSGLAGTAYGAYHSLPGQTLFSLKKTAEQIQVHFTSDPVAKANIQVSIAQKRLADAEEVFSTPGKTSAQEIAALNELSQQTKQAASTVKSAAATNGLSSNDHPVVNSLVDMTKKQQVLLSKIQTSNDVTVAANTALAANKEAKEVIAVVAATNDQATLTKLNPNPNAVTISGAVSTVRNDSFSVGDHTFTVNETTEIKGFDGTVMVLSALTPGTTVNVIASKNNDQLIAKEIIAVTIDKLNTSGEVKGSATTTTSTIPSKTQIPEVKKTESSTSTKRTEIPTSTPIEIDPNAAIGSFIPEMP